MARCAERFRQAAHIFDISGQRNLRISPGPGHFRKMPYYMRSLLLATGTAVPGATVVVQGATSTNERDRAWAADIVPANSIKAVKGTANVYSVLLGQGAGGRDKFKLAGAGFFIPKALQAFEYDDDGNLKHDSVWDYYYDGENRLVAMEHRSEVMGGSALANADKRRMEFRYDYKGRRVRKTVYGGWNGAVFNATPLCDTKFLYDGWNLIAELDALSPSTLPLIRSYTWGLDLTGSLTASGGVGALLQIHDYAGAGKTLLPAYDGNGNVVALFDATSGAVEARYEYNAFGELIRSEGTYAQQNNFRFSTKFTDSESGLVYYGYRFYSPALGRFVNKDPLEESGGVNLYAFVSNRVVGGFDYLGLNGTVWVMDGSSGEGTPIDPQILAQEWLDQRNRDSRFNQFVNNSMARLMDFKGAGTALLYQRRLSGMPDSTRDWAAHFWHVNDWLTGFHRVAAQVEAFEQKIRAHADAAIRSGWASLSDGMMFSDGSIAGVSRGGEAAAVGLGGIYAKPPLRPDLSGWDRMTQASARTGPTLAAFTSGSIENLSIRTGASVNIVSVGSDATFSYAAKDGAIEGELTGTFGAPKGVSAIVFATVEGRVPLYNKNTDFSAGFLAAPLVAFGITVDFSKVPTALTQFFGWRYTPTGIRFNLGVGIGGSATVDSVDASTTLMKVEVKNDGTRTRSGVFDRKGP